MQEFHTVKADPTELRKQPNSEARQATEPAPDEQADAKNQGSSERDGLPFADRYVILSCIGTGGMGAIYLAKHTLMDRLVALKLLLPHRGLDRTSLGRFQQEARAASQLAHPNIVNVFDFGVSDEGIPYLAMEYIEGTSFDQIIKSNGPLDLQRALNIFKQTCGALEEAHNHGVIHRDLKPSNIIITNTGTQKDLVKIVDFGIAKLASPVDSNNAHLTMTGEVVGSPPYMSPEQCSGDPLDRRSDIYSMGCVMYEALSGTSPFKGASFMEIALKHLKEAPPSLSRLRREVKGIEQIENVILKALAKDPAHRYRTMLELRLALEEMTNRLSGGYFARAKCWWNSYSLRSEAREKRASPAGALLLTLSMALVLALPRVWIPANEGTRAPKTNAVAMSDPLTSWTLLDIEGQRAFNRGDYAAALANLQSAAKLAETFAKTDRLAFSLEKLAILYHVLAKPEQEKQVDERLDGLKASAPGSMTDDEASHQSGILEGALAILPEDPSKIDRGRFNELARQMNMLAGHYIDHGKPDQARKLLDKLVPKIKQILGRRHERMAVAMTYVGEALADIGQYAKAEVAHRESLAIREQIFDESDPRLAKGLMDLGKVLASQDKFLEAQRLYERALAAYSVSKRAKPEDVASLCQRIAGVCWDQHKYSASEHYYKRAIALYEKTSNHESIAGCLGRLAVMYMKQGDGNRAERTFLQALSRAERELGSNHEDLVWYLEWLANFYYGRREFSRAEPIFLRALAIRQHSMPLDTEGLYGVLHNVCGVYYMTGRSTQAEPFSRQKLAMTERAEGPDLHEVLSSVDGLALLCHAQGKQAEARALAQRALATLLKTPANDYQEIDHELYTIARFYFSRGDYDKVEEWLKKAVAYLRLKKGNDHLDTAQALDDLAHLYHVQGRTGDEEQPSKEAMAIVEKNPYTEPVRTAQIVENYGSHLRRAGRYSESAACVARANEIRRGTH